MKELFEAIRSGDCERVETLLDGDRALLECDSDGTPALLYALYHGHPEVVPLFTKRGRNPRFHEACALGLTEELQRHLENDPQLASRLSDDGYSPVALAIFFRQPAAAAFLIERGGDVSTASANPQRVAPVHAAAAVGDRSSLRLLLDRGADPGARQQGDFTPLHAAASRGDIAMAELLLEYGAPADAVTTDGLTVADVARKYDRSDFAAWLKSRD
jgi:ankyrin repeat protein